MTPDNSDWLLILVLIFSVKMAWVIFRNTQEQEKLNSVFDRQARSHSVLVEPKQ